MWSWSFGGLLLFIAVVPSWCQLIFLMEPPPRLSFSNTTGAKVSCAAHGTPVPTITWLTEDGAPVSDVPGLRNALPNGTLWLGAFSSEQYRSDVHASVYRCRAASTVGSILSRDMRLEAVMDVSWDVRVQSSHGVAGGTALLTCSVPSAVKNHVSVTKWYKDGAVLAPIALDGGQYIIGGSRGDLLVLRDAKVDDTSSYSCEAQHSLTGEKRRSMSTMISVSHSMGSMAPRILAVSEDETVLQGGDIRLVCCAFGSPTPTYSWFRHSNGRLSPVSNSIRISVSEQVLIIRRAEISDGGIWTCRAHNQYGEQRRDARLTVRSRMVVTVHPQLQIANSGSSVSFNCSVEGGDARIRWLHDGVPVGGGDKVLRVYGVARAHRGMYQCFAERDLDSAQAAAELRLGDTAPELHYTFIEQALHPGPALALHCAASGSPSPRFTWLLDNQPIEEHGSSQRSVMQFMNPNGDVVSYLNISSVRPEDGGRYTCRATNSRGMVEHSTRLNVYGPPSIRSAGPVRVVAGENSTVYCPFTGFPISEIRWLRGGVEVGGSPSGAGAGAEGALRLRPADGPDAGAYTCRVTAPSGLYAEKDIQIFVRNPPKIAGFSFPSDLVEGSSVQVLCGITSGDKPVYFSWLKDGQHIPPSLQVQEKSLDEFSFLIFSHVTSKHSGEYTCVASNSASEVNHTARLAVKVAPTWLYEPQDVSTLLGTHILAHCATKGYPEPKVAWFKGHGSGVDFKPISNMDLQYSVLPNGSLSILPAGNHHEGQYMCRAENGIGRGLSKVITVSVNEPAHFEFPSRNMSVKRGGAATLVCAARGDPPVQLLWTHNTAPLDLSSYRLSVSEKRSASGASSSLIVSRAERQDSGVYRCRADNAYGRDDLLIYLAVQEFPEAPRGLTVRRAGGRGALLQWRLGYDGNARVRSFRVQARAAPPPTASSPSDWSSAPARTVPVEHVSVKQEFQDPESEVIMEYRVEGLRPATAYALRIAAVNDIGESDYCDSVTVQTTEEAPSEPPHNVQVQAVTPGELLVKWQGPPQESWNGELLGYAVSWHEVGSPAAGSLLSLAAWSAVLAPLRPLAHYEVRVRAYTAAGAGPAAPPITVSTLEGAPEAPPERVRCETLSPQSARVWWDAPPAHARGGLLLGYELIYQVVDDFDSQVESRRAGGMEAVLQSLQRAANYSISVRARTAAGAGPTSEPVYCTTHEDIPGPPADVKALANSEDTVIVSWLAPTHKNGKIKHYTVYSRPQRGGPQSRQQVWLGADEAEGSAEVRVAGGAHLEFWVTAATAAGEGEMSAVVSRKPTARAPAAIWSFGREVWGVVGRTLRLRCGAAGGAVRRTWARARPAPPLASDPRFLIEDDYLVILNADRSVSDNYTCSVRNAFGADRAAWRLHLHAPPPAPRPRPARPAPASLRLQWDPTPHANSYTLQHSRADSGSWIETRLPADSRGYTLERLSCGTMYKVRLIAHNAVGDSPPSEELLVSTTGGLSRAPKETSLISSNSTCVSLNLLAWQSNGCPVNYLRVSVREVQGGELRSLQAIEHAVICHLTPATWYQLTVSGTNDAGNTEANYYFATLDENGERIPAPASFPPRGGAGGARGAVAAAATASLAALILLAVLLYRRSSSAKCLRKGYEQGDISEEEEKSVEKRDNRRNCQQVYTSSPIKHPISKKEQQEMYEISPYATFSMAGGASGEGTVASARGDHTLRTFGRGEPELAATPPTHSDEYTLSRAMTLMVRPTETDSDSSDSPCAECTSSVSYRMPATEEVFRGAPDHSDKRRRARSRHPHSARYQQRQEQERRDFTIHV